MLKRYIGPYDEVRVVVAGDEIGYVRQGESIAVPDDVANSVEWPGEHWQDGAPVRATGKDKG